MKNFLPDFIAEKYSLNQISGSFDALTLFLDISGFTPMTELLMHEGKEGAEILSVIINDIFEPVIETVYGSGGFLAAFSGDAFTAIFTNSDNPDTAAACALKIVDIFNRIGRQQTKFGIFNLLVKIGLSAGNVEYNLLNSTKQMTYYFKGDAIDGCAESEHRALESEVVADHSFIQRFTSLPVGMMKKEDFFYRIIEVNTPISPAILLKRDNLPVEILQKFIPDQVLNMHQAGEFRDIVSVFVSLRESANAAEINQLIQRTVEETQRFGGYFNRVSFGDKGGVMPIFFGMPQSYENNLVRALDFALELQKLFPERIRIGLNSGIAYAGFIGSSLMSEYTAYGDIVNQSARFMANAGWGKIWLSEKAAKQSSGFYRFTDLGNMSFKGKSRPIAVYELTNKADNSETAFFDGQIIGRKSELALLNDFANPLSAGMFAGIVTVYADAGIGKSRLVYEFTRSMHTAEVLFLQTDSVLKMSLNPFKYLLHNYFNQKVADKEDKKSNFEAIYNLLLQILSNSPDSRKTDIIKELERTKSILAAQLEIYYENSLYEQLDAKTRFENTLYAYKEFFKALALFKPVIIQIEDIHWLDEDSHKLVQTLCRAVEDFPLLIIATSRLNDDGSKPAFIVNPEVPQHQLMLEKMDQDSAAALIRLQLDGEADADLLSFIAQKGEFNPFFIEQTILYLKESSLLCIKDKCYSLSSDQITIPDGISALIIARIDRLAGELKEIVQLASVFGREVELKVFLLMIELYQSNLNHNQVGELLEKIENEQLWHKFAEIKYIFKHALLNEAAYEMQLKSRLRELHRLAAQSMEKIHFNEEDKYYEIARHYSKAEMIDESIEYFKKAGEWLKKNYQNEKAVECYDCLLTLLDDEKDAEQIIEVLNDKGEVLETIGKWSDAEDVYQLASDLTYRTTNTSLQIVSSQLLAMIKNSRGFVAEALDILLKTKQLAINFGDKKLYSSILFELAVVYKNSGDYSKALACNSESEKICLESADRVGYAKNIHSVGLINLKVGNPSKAMECFEGYKSVCLELGIKDGYLVVLSNISIIYKNQGDYSKALEALYEAKAIAVQLGNKYRYASVINNIGVVYFYLEDYDNALACYTEFKNISIEIDSLKGYANALGNIGIIHSINDNFSEALTCYKEKMEICLKLDDKFEYARTQGHLGSTFYELGDCSQALISFNDALETARQLNSRSLICELLNSKASFLYNTNQLLESELLSREALLLAEESGRQDIVSKINSRFEELNIKKNS